MALADYIRPIASPSFQWIAFLHLSNTNFTRTEMVNLTSLSNLGALTIAQRTDPDSVIAVFRSWARAAEESGAFPMLRVVAFRKQKSLSPKIIEHATQLPALSILLFEDCGLGTAQRPVAERYGWKYRTGKALSGMLVHGGAASATWDQVIKAAWIQGGKFCEERMTKEGVEAVDELPVASLHLGGEQPEAMVDKTGNDCLRAFVRLKHVDLPVTLDERSGTSLVKSIESERSLSGTSKTPRPNAERRFRSTAAHEPSLPFVNGKGTRPLAPPTSTQNKRPSPSVNDRLVPKKRAIKNSRIVDNAFAEFGL